MSEVSRQELDAKLPTAEGRTEARLASLETTMKTGFADLRTEMERLRCEMHKATVNLIKWGVPLVLGGIGTTAGMLHFISKVP